MRAFWVVVALLCGSAAVAEVPLSIPFEGRLTDASGQPVPDGAYNVRFTVYNATEGAKTVASETHIVQSATFTLSHAPVVADSEVIKKSDNTVTYTRGAAYTIDDATGTVTRSSATAIPDGTNVTVSYQWTAAQEAQNTATVQAKGGAFGAAITLSSAAQLSGQDWVQVEVDRGGGSWEALHPWLRLYSAPYALQVATLNGASGGETFGDLTVNGSLLATGLVSGSARSYLLFRLPMTVPGVMGTGVSGTGGDAPGVLAVGSNDGAGLGLQVQGRADVTGALTVGGDVRGATMHSTGLLTAGAVTVSGAISATGALQAQSVVATQDVNAANLHATGYVIGDQGLQGISLQVRDATVNGSLEATKLTATSLGADTITTPSLAAGTVSAGSVQVSGSVTVDGRLHAHGYPQPDFDSGLRTISAGAAYSEFFMPASMGSDIDAIVVELHETSFSGEYRWPEGMCAYRYIVRRSATGVLVVRVLPHDNGTTPQYFRLRVWKVDP